jgi:hypothetical protein
MRIYATFWATLAATGFVGELKAEGEEEGEDEFNKRFGGAQERKVGRLIAEVDGDRAVVTYRFGSVSHVSSPGQMPLARMRHGEGNVLKDQASCERLGSSPLNSVECGVIYQGQVTLDASVFNLKHHWSSVNCQELELYGLP